MAVVTNQSFMNDIAHSYFREKEKFEMLPSSSNEESVKVSKKKSSKKKKNSNASEWTWKDQVEMVKWTDKMINVSAAFSTHTLIAPTLWNPFFFRIPY